MFQMLNALGLIVFVWVIVLDLAFYHHRPPWYETWDVYFAPGHCLSALLVFAVNAVTGTWYFAVLYAGLGVVGGWLWWSTTDLRRQRRRLAQREAREREGADPFLMHHRSPKEM